MQDILNERNINVSADDLIQYKSYGYNNIQWLKSKNIEDNLAKEINIDWISRIEAAEYLKFDHLYLGIKDMLERLSAENNLYLVTARNNKANLFNQLKELDIIQYFEDICVVPSCKESMKFKADYLKEHSINTFWGDTEVDKQAADTAGCNFHLCLNGFRNQSFWDRYYQENNNA